MSLFGLVKEKPQKRPTWKELLKAEAPLLLPAAHDALTAKIIEHVGFKAYQVGGFALAGARYGYPNIDLVHYGEQSAGVRDIIASCDLPVMIDADDCYGDAKNVERTIRGYEALGAGAIFFEDQLAPKKCGHMQDKKVVPIEMMAHKVAAAVHARGCSGYELGPSDKQTIAGKTFVITGASSGFGRGVAIKLGSLHANVVLAARRTEVLNQVAREVASAGGTPLVVPTDVAKPEEVQHLADAAIARFGHIDVWINDAGVGALGRFEDIPIKDQARLIDINLKGVVYGSHAAMRHFDAQGHGTLINLGSVDSIVPLAYMATYAATKAAILGLDQALNQEIRLDGKGDRINVVTIMPYAVDTPWWDHAANYSGHEPRMTAMDDPQMVVDAIIHASAHPTDKVPVGWKAQAASASHRIAPDLTERMSANAIHKSMFEEAPAARATGGTLFQPMQSGIAVDGGVRARMEREDKQRKPDNE